MQTEISNVASAALSDQIHGGAHITLLISNLDLCCLIPDCPLPLVLFSVKLNTLQKCCISCASNGSQLLIQNCFFYHKYQKALKESMKGIISHETSRTVNSF